MSAYTDADTSSTGARPIECFKFVGQFKTYYYTSAPDPINVFGNVYEPIAIQRSRIKLGTNSEDNIDINIRLPITTQLAVDYSRPAPPQTLGLIIYRTHLGLNQAVDPVVYWAGPVTAFSIPDDICEIKSPSNFSSYLATSAPSRYFQQPCNNTLYDGFCKVSRALHMVTTTVVDYANRTLQVASVGAFPDGYFFSGEVYVPSTGERRGITGHSSTILQLRYPFAKLPIGATVEVAAGCDHSWTGDCLTKFNNRVNYGGTPFVPLVNPFAVGL